MKEFVALTSLYRYTTYYTLDFSKLAPPTFVQNQKENSKKDQKKNQVIQYKGDSLSHLETTNKKQTPDVFPSLEL